MYAADNDVVLDLSVLERCQRLTDDRPCFILAVHVVVVHHLLVFPFLLVYLIAIGCREPHILHTHSCLLDNMRLVYIPVVFFIFISFFAAVFLLEAFG